MHKLLNIGFQAVGYWILESNKIKPFLTDHLQANNVIYCFTLNGEIKYFGITRKPFINRMLQYSNPGKSQSSNIRLNKLILDEIIKGHTIDIFLFVDNSLISYGEFRVNLALGLEDSLIEAYKSSWNYRGNSRIIEQDEMIENPELIKEIHTKEFPIKVVATYLKSGFINIPGSYSDNFGKDMEQIEVSFNGNVYLGNINRHSNGGYPRIYVGPPLSKWISSNFSIGEEIIIQLFSKKSIKLISKIKES